MSIIENLKKNQTNAEEVKRAFIEIVSEYMSPAYGSMTKREFDILMFMKLQDLGVMSSNPDVFEIVSSLRVTRAKARNLLYEAKMRSATEEQLDEELRDLLISPIFLELNGKIAIEIGNPLLSDRIKAKLKKLGHITDGSFSQELIKLTIPAYISLFEDMMPKESRKKVTDALIACGAKKDTSLKGILLSIVKNIGKKVAGEVGDQLIEGAVTYLQPLMEGGTDVVKNAFKDFFTQESNDVHA